MFVDDLTIEDRPIEQLRILVERASGRALSPSGTEVALAADACVAASPGIVRSSGVGGSTARTVRSAVLLVAWAAARSGRRAEASTWLKRADAIATSAVNGRMRPWLDAEANALRDEVLKTLNRSSTLRATSTR